MNIEPIEQAIWIAVGTLTAIQLLYSLVMYNAPHRRWAKEKKNELPQSEKCPGMSVIIASSNHEEQLAKHLPRILEQDYPDFEVIVVDDFSTDETKALLERFCKQYPNLYTTYTSDSIRYISHKKLALMLGIKAAKKEWIVFIEPDCYPVSNQWLVQLARQCTEQTDVVLGYSNYEHKKGFANLCHVFDTLQQQMRMLGLTLLKKGYMGIGRNMAYRREIFFSNKGYSRHLDLERGEDDLFINEHVPANRIAASISADSAVRCSSSNGYTWQNDKLCRLFLRRKMKGAALHILSTDTLTRALLYVATILGLTFSIMHHWWISVGIVSALWFIHIGARILVFRRFAHDMEERRYGLSILLLDIIHPCWELYFRLRLRLMPKTMHMRRQV